MNIRVVAWDWGDVWDHDKSLAAAIHNHSPGPNTPR